MAFVDITGKTFGQLTVLNEVLPRGKVLKWLCLCSCGNTKEIIGASLKNGSTKSCGCLHIAQNKKQFTKHGGYLTKLYQIHRAMLQRCGNPKHKMFLHYGARGITICDEWLDYLTFQKWANATGYSENLSIERIDVNKGYSPANCCWADKTQQARNRRALHGYSSKYIGVSFDADRNKWFACIGIGRKTIALGRFASEIEAAKARDTYITENNLKHFVLNFP